jgi:hypothetical protein
LTQELFIARKCAGRLQRLKVTMLMDLGRPSLLVTTKQKDVMLTNPKANISYLRSTGRKMEVI